ncbi:ATP-binding protein, partial [Parabacteroides distasonis]
ERFEKLDDFIQGTGLGLSVCQIISEQLNGSLSVDISYKDGARFVFIHPTNLIETPI